MTARSLILPRRGCKKEEEGEKVVYIGLHRSMGVLITEREAYGTTKEDRLGVWRCLEIGHGHGMGISMATSWRSGRASFWIDRLTRYSGDIASHRITSINQSITWPLRALYLQ